MIIDEGVYTQRTAQEVASHLHHLINHPEVGLVKLDVRYERKRSGESPPMREESTYWVRLLKPHDEAVVSLANGGEVVHLETDEGRRLDVFLGTPAIRDLEPALVLLAPE